MKFILAALLLQHVVCEQEADSEETDIFADKQAIWKYQEPVEFESIEASEEDDGSKFSLSGQYGGYMTAGVGYTFVQMTVGGAELQEGSQVLVWGQIKNKTVDGNEVEEVDRSEGFYCLSTYSKEQEYSESNSAATFAITNQELQLGSATGAPDTWFADGSTEGIERLTDPVWTVFTANMESNYPSSWEEGEDEEEGSSSQACGVWRKIQVEGALELKFGKKFSYALQTGFKVYQVGSDEPVEEGQAEESITMELESAINLMYCATALSTAALLTF